MLLRGGKPKTYDIRVIIQKIIAVKESLFGPNDLIMGQDSLQKITITFSRIKVDKYGMLYLNLSNSHPAIIDKIDNKTCEIILV